MKLRLALRQRRRSRWVVVSVVAIVVVLAVALWFARGRVVASLVERMAAQVGFGPTEIEVLALGLSSASLRVVNSSIGVVDSIEVDYVLAFAHRPSLEGVRIRGARLHLAPREGSLGPVAFDAGGSSSRAWPATRIDIVDSNLTLELESGVVSVALAGSVTSGPVRAADLALAIRAAQGTLRGHLTVVQRQNRSMVAELRIDDGAVSARAVSVGGLAGRVRIDARGVQLDSLDAAVTAREVRIGSLHTGEARFTAVLQPATRHVDLSVRSASLQSALHADVSDPARGIPFTVSGTALPSLLGALTGKFTVAGGTIELQASGAAPPFRRDHAAQSLSIANWLAQGHVEVEVHVEVRSLDAPQRATVRSAAGTLTLSLAEGGVSVRLPAPVRIDGAKLSTPFVAADSPLAQISMLEVSGVKALPLLTVKDTAEGGATANIAAAVRLASPRLNFNGPLRGAVVVKAPLRDIQTAGDLAVGTFSLSAEFALRALPDLSWSSLKTVSDGRYVLAPSSLDLVFEQGSISLADGHWKAALSIPSLQANLRAGATFSRDRQTGAMCAEATLQRIRAALHVVREPQSPQAFAVSADRIAVGLAPKTHTIRLDNGTIDWPDKSLRASGIAGTFDTAAATALRFKVADIRSTAAPVLFSPLQATGSATTTGAAARFTAAVKDFNGHFNSRIDGVHHLEGGEGSARIVVAPIDLARPHTLSELSPALAGDVRSSGGTLAADAALHWGDRALPHTASVVITDAAVTSPRFKASALTGALHLDALLPPRSKRGQRVDGIVDLAGIGRVPVALTFHLEPTKLVLEKVDAGLFDGRVQTTDAEFDLTHRTGHLDLEILNLDLAAAFKVLNLEGLKGTGRLNGRLPLQLEGNRVRLDHGQLASEGPGTLQIGVTTLADKLKGYGENVDLAFRALTDFHYERLLLEANKPLHGAGTVVCRLEGRNPEVLAGQPFIFNINLETDFDYLTELLRRTSGLANTVFGWGINEGER